MFGPRRLAPVLLAAALLSGCGRRPPPRRLHTGGRHVVVLLPGWMSGGAQVKPLSDAIGDVARAEVHRLQLKGLGVSGTLPEYADELEAYIAKLRLGPQDRLDLVGFSFGGLVCRWYAEVLRGAPRPHWIVTVCTPHHGTRRGKWLKAITTLREMQPGSKAILKLHRRRRKDIRYFSVRLSRDNVVEPRFSSVLSGAKNYEIDGKSHQTAPYSRSVTRAVQAIYLGTAKPSGPQELTDHQRALLKLDPSAKSFPKPPDSAP
jgi:pimeloyl-ACP methyl ester carboxylesterase